MGMFDVIKCEFPLPDSEVQNDDFQSKDLACKLLDYTITKEGKLLCGCGKTYQGEWHGFDRETQHPISYTGEVHLYTSRGNYINGDFKSYDYYIEFKSGLLLLIRQKV